MNFSFQTVYKTYFTRNAIHNIKPSIYSEYTSLLSHCFRNVVGSIELKHFPQGRLPYVQNTEQKPHTMKPIVNARYSKGDSYTKQLTTQLSETTNLNGNEIIQLHDFD